MDQVPFPSVSHTTTKIIQRTIDMFLPLGVIPGVPVGHVGEGPVQEYGLKVSRKQKEDSEFYINVF